MIIKSMNEQGKKIFGEDIDGFNSEIDEMKNVIYDDMQKHHHNYNLHSGGRLNLDIYLDKMEKCFERLQHIDNMLYKIDWHFSEGKKNNGG